MMNNNNLSGKIALVTGGSRGIGRAIALALGDAGCDTLINYQCQDEAAEEVVAELKKKNVRAKAYKADISNDVESIAMVKAIKEEFGTVDILVNNAAINRDRSFLKMTKAMWDEVLGVNLNGPFNITHELLPGMVEKNWGRVINIASMNGQTGNFGQANYTVTKGGLIAFTFTLAREFARKGITVNAISPGYTETDMTKGIPAAGLEQLKAVIPLGRLGQPEEVAAAVAFVASPSAGYITGQVIGVNGGMYM
jgi:NAD(P)-dependent dehydrogenase (short-subunit alcohol dehydrogenase family)